MSLAHTTPGTSLADRLLTRLGTRPSIGPKAEFYRRFGLPDPLAPIESLAGEEDGWFSFLSGAGYRRDLALRRWGRFRIMHRLGDQRSASLRRRSRRHARAEALPVRRSPLSEELAIDQVNLLAPPLPEPQPMARPEGIRRAISRDTARGSSRIARELLALLSEVRGADRERLREIALRVEAVPERSQLAVAQRAIRALRGASRWSAQVAADQVAARAVGGAVRRSASTEHSPVDRAVSRGDSTATQGLRRVLSRSPSVSAVEKAAVARAAIRVRAPMPAAPVIFAEPPVAAAVGAARSQLAAGRAGPDPVSRRDTADSKRQVATREVSPGVRAQRGAVGVPLAPAEAPIRRQSLSARLAEAVVAPPASPVARGTAAARVVAGEFTAPRPAPSQSAPSRPASPGAHGLERIARRELAGSAGETASPLASAATAWLAPEPPERAPAAERRASREVPSRTGRVRAARAAAGVEPELLVPQVSAEEAASGAPGRVGVESGRRAQPTAHAARRPSEPSVRRLSSPAVGRTRELPVGARFSGVSSRAGLLGDQPPRSASRRTGSTLERQPLRSSASDRGFTSPGRASVPPATQGGRAETPLGRRFPVDLQPDSIAHPGAVGLAVRAAARGTVPPRGDALGRSLLAPAPLAHLQWEREVEEQAADAPVSPSVAEPRAPRSREVPSSARRVGRADLPAPRSAPASPVSPAQTGTVLDRTPGASRSELAPSRRVAARAGREASLDGTGRARLAASPVPRFRADDAPLSRAAERAPAGAHSLATPGSDAAAASFLGVGARLPAAGSRDLDRRAPATSFLGDGAPLPVAGPTGEPRVERTPRATATPRRLPAAQRADSPSGPASSGLGSGLRALLRSVIGQDRSIVPRPVGRNTPDRAERPVQRAASERGSRPIDPAAFTLPEPEFAEESGFPRAQGPRALAATVSEARRPARRASLSAAIELALALPSTVEAAAAGPIRVAGRRSERAPTAMRSVRRVVSEAGAPVAPTAVPAIEARIALTGDGRIASATARRLGARGEPVGSVLARPIADQAVLPSAVGPAMPSEPAVAWAEKRASAGQDREVARSPAARAASRAESPRAERGGPGVDRPRRVVRPVVAGLDPVLPVGFAVPVSADGPVSAPGAQRAAARARRPLTGQSARAAVAPEGALAAEPRRGTPRNPRLEAPVPAVLAGPEAAMEPAAIAGDRRSEAPWSARSAPDYRPPGAAPRRDRAEPSRTSARPSARRTRILSALARADQPEELVRVILDQANTSELVRELPAPAARLVERIARLGGEEGIAGPSLLRGGPAPQASRPRGNAPVMRPLSPGGSGGLGPRRSRTSPASAVSQDGVGASNVMKLAGKLMKLIHLAEVERKLADAQAQVRMAADSGEARAEGGQGAASGPAEGLGDSHKNMEALHKEVLEAVMKELEQNSQRRGEEDSDVGSWF